MHERRRDQRYQRVFSISLRGRDYKGFDISNSGLSFSASQSDNKLKLGQRFPNVIVTQAPNEPYEIAAVEICSVRKSNGQDIYGARIIHLSEQAKLYHNQLTFGLDSKELNGSFPNQKTSRSLKERISSAKIIFSEDSTPRLPEQIQALQAELDQQHINTSHIAKLVNQQPEVLIEFIQTVKQTLPEDKHQAVHNASSAIRAIGFENVYNFFLSSCLSNCIAEDEFEIDLLQHSLRLGLAASELALWVHDINQSEAYLAGILQNIGAIYLARKLQQVKYQALLKEQRFYPWAAYQTELENYDTTHVYVGAVVMKNWSIDPDIIKSTLLHHNALILSSPSSTPRIDTISALLMLANYAVGAAYGEDKITEELLEYKHQAMQALQMPENAVDSAIAKILRINPPEEEQEAEQTLNTNNNLDAILDEI